MSKRQPVFEDAEVYPPSMSQSGTNAFYHRCDAVEHMAAYASCLNHIANRKNGKLDSIFSTCSAEIGQRRCPAIDMQKKELAAGKALFFLSRTKLQEFSNEQTEGLVLTPSTTKVTKVKWDRPPSPPPKKQVDLSGNDYAGAINAAMSKPKVAMMNIQHAQKGLSMLEIARAALAQKVSQ